MLHIIPENQTSRIFANNKIRRPPSISSQITKHIVGKVKSKDGSHKDDKSYVPSMILYKHTGELYTMQDKNCLTINCDPNNIFCSYFALYFVYIYFISTPHTRFSVVYNFIFFSSFTSKYLYIPFDNKQRARRKTFLFLFFFLRFLSLKPFEN